MKKTILLTAALLTFPLISYTQSAGEIRPIRDDVGFCWQDTYMNRLMGYLESVLPEDKALEIPGLVAGISPHDDYLYAGKAYYPLFKNVRAKEVVIFGVTHRTVRLKIGDPQEKLIFDDYPAWRGPYGKVQVSKLREFLLAGLPKDLAMVSNEAHKLEHSIEAFIPFLQYFNRDIQITPIMVTGMDLPAIERHSAVLASLLVKYMRKHNLEPVKDILFLVSADANHYGRDFDNIVFGEDERAHELGTSSDEKIARTYLTGEVTGEKLKGLTGQLWGKTYRDSGDRVWCGKYSIPFGVSTIMKTLEALYPNKKLTGTLLRYSDTYSSGVLPLKKPGCGITAPFSLKHWVGYFSTAFTLE